MKFFGKLFLISLSLFTGVAFGSHEVQAADSITPSTIDIPLHAGQSFHLDILFVSGQGGEYDVTIKQFVFDADGEKVFREDAGFMELSTSLLDLHKDDRKVIVLSGIAPEDFPDGDYYYSVHVTRRKDDPKEIFTTNLASLVYLKVGKNDRYHIDVSAVELIRQEDQSVDTVKFNALNTTDRYFTIFPTLTFSDSQKTVLKQIKGDDLRVFPNVLRRGGLVWFEKENFVVPPETKKIQFQILNELGEALYDQEMSELGVGDTILAKTRTALINHSGLQLRVKNDFLWTDWVLHIVMMVMGLSLLLYYFYDRP